ncbi:MAG: thioredoxin family protein [Gammaproteobacteria bacterium]|nr:thioredoxin family protein [Gammaproteobacteria bacterium]
MTGDAPPLKRYNTLTQFDFHHLLSQTPGIAVVYFTSAGCASCRHWREVLQQLLKRRLDIRVFEVDAAQDQALTREFEVFHLPALFVFRDGHYRGPLLCEARTTLLDAAIDAASALPPQDMP